MAPQQPHAVPVRVQAAVYATALFSGNLFHIGSVILPLWARMLDPSPIMIGIFLGARQILPVLLSIHGGAMMDRFGARRVILIVGLLSAVTMALFPAMPWFGAAIVLQMLNGLAESNNWIGGLRLAVLFLSFDRSGFFRCGGSLFRLRQCLCHGNGYVKGAAHTKFAFKPGLSPL